MKTILITWGALVALAIVAKLAFYLLKGNGRSRYQQALDDFFTARIRAGSNFLEAVDLLTLQEEFARLRVVASDRVISEPTAWLRILDEEKAAGVRRLSRRRDLAFRFAEAVSGVPYTHILYPDAARAAEAQMPAYLPCDATDIQWAALTRARPS